MKKKTEDNATAAAAAIAAGLGGVNLTSGGRVTYRSRAELRQAEPVTPAQTDHQGELSLLVNGSAVMVTKISSKNSSVSFEIEGRSYQVELQQSTPETGVGRKIRSTAISKSSGEAGQITSPLPGIVAELLCKVGDEVTSGQLLLRIEAMKMQNNVYADSVGSVADILVNVSDEVSTGQLLVVIK